MSGQGAFSAILVSLIAAASTARAALKTELVTSGFGRPLFVTAPPGDTNRLFVLEQHTGRIRIVDLAAKTIQSDPFLVVTNLLIGSEQGLLGLAFHPNYRSNGFFYINQVAPGGGAAGHTEVNRFQATGDPLTSNSADPSSKKLILSFDQPESNHNGGWLGFGPDGFLYISTGDGGGGNDQHGTPGNGQRRNTLLGKILRIDIDNADPYGIPEGNPYRASLSLENEIWAFGLRNPWRCSFDRATGDLWIGDVGQDTREEIDLIPAGTGGLNFGWRPREGLSQNRAYPDETPVTPAVDPLYDYGHDVGRSVTGGYVYRGTAIPELAGKYIFADYSSARFWELTRTGTNQSVREITSQLNPSPKQINQVSSFGEDAAGELYICDYSDGQLYRITSDAPPGIALQAAHTSGGELQIAFGAAANEGYLLESRGDFSAGTSWSVVTNVPAGAARPVTLTQPLASAQQFFRLRTQ